MTEKQKELIGKILSDYPDTKEMHEYEDYLASQTIGTASEFISRAVEDNAEFLLSKKTYADYIATRPRAQRFGSHGLFTDDGTEIKLTNVSEELNTHNGNVWTAIVSLRREDSERLHWHGRSDRLYLFEAPIDMLSYISLHSDDWQKHSYAASCGVSEHVMWQMMKDNPSIRTVYLCRDNDIKGQEANQRTQEALFVKGIKSEILIPHRKDWNEDLLYPNESEESECQEQQLL